MGQKVETSNYGTVEFDEIYADINAGRVGRLLDGAWVYYPTGRPFATKNELKTMLNKVNPTKTKEALAWWDRAELQAASEAEHPAREIYFDPTGQVRFRDDDTLVDRADDLIAYFAPGSYALELALRLFSAQKEQAHADFVDTNARVFEVSAEVAGETFKAQQRAKRAAIAAGEEA